MARKSNVPQMVRQGDVALVRVAEIPSGAKALAPQARVTLALGEVTGHAHVLVAAPGTTITPFRVEDAVDAAFVEIMTEAFLEHEEHNPHTLPAGTYRIVRQREYSPEAIRNVAD